MSINFQTLLESLLIEELHPDLKSIVSSKEGYHSKQSELAKKIRHLSSRGEKTGIENNVPKGSSRAYLKHSEPHEITLDGKKAHIHTGTKVAIRASLDKHHDHDEHEGMRLGHLQNNAENGDHWVNNNYRILTHDSDHPGHYHSNKGDGIFPPLINHDDEHHEWSHVGHARDLKHNEFRELTKTKSHPKGISHKDFSAALERFHNRNHGNYHEDAKRDKHLDHIAEHPLVNRFIDYHGNSGNPPNDLRQRKNMGVFEHPDGSKHIVARDHGMNGEVAHAYDTAFKRQAEARKRRHRGY